MKDKNCVLSYSEDYIVKNYEVLLYHVTERVVTYFVSVSHRIVLVSCQSAEGLNSKAETK